MSGLSPASESVGQATPEGVLKLSWPEPKGFWQVPVVFEDEHLLALNKPAGLLSSPDRYDPKRPNLMALLHTGIAKPAQWARARNLTYLANAHRLDFDTTGVFLTAKSKDVLRALADQFGSEKPHKVYYAIVQGHPAEPVFEVDARLAHCERRLGAMRVSAKQGKKSITRFELVETFRSWSLIKCLPLTGRTHQIRVHLQHAGLPIVADQLYGGGPLLLSQLKRGYRVKPGELERPLAGTLALHAASLEIEHPVAGGRFTITAPMPNAMEVALKYLRKFALIGGV